MNTRIYNSIQAFALTLLTILFATGSVFAQVSAYNYQQSTGSYTEITGGTVVATATGTSGAASLDDVIYTVANGTIPFTFTFDNVGYTGLKISTNGFITFGTTAPAASGTTTGYVPLSATTAYSGAASPLGRNLNAYFFSGVPSQTGEIRYQTLGAAPNRTFVIQWKNFKTFNTSGATFGPVLNFQVRLSEGSNAVEFRYNCSGAFTSSTAQVGLRGANNAFPSNINNRSVASGVNTWISSTAGTANTSTCEFSSSLMPPSGLSYIFAPSSCPAPQNVAATNATQNTAQLTWTTSGGGGTFTVEYGPTGFTVGTGTILNNVVSGVTITGLTPTSNYQFYVKQLCGANGNSSNVGPISFATGGPGEDCATATLISVANNLGACSFTTVNSGVSANGPNAICSDFNGNGANDDKWFKFVAPSGGNKLIITTTAGTVNDWVMEVWSGCPGSGSMMYCSDDVNGGMPEISLCQNEYVAGQTYFIRIWTYSTTATGTANLCVYKATACPLPPSNDECISAIRLTVNPPLSCPASQTTQTDANATPNTDGATCDAGTKRDVWFVFNTGNFGDIRMTISPGTATTLKAQLLFECGGFEIGCYSPANGTYTFTGLNPQADYIIRVWSDSGTAGTFNICLADICSNPTATFGANQSICTGQTAGLPVNFTGVPPFSLTYKNNSTNQNTTINNITSNPYLIQLSPASTTSYSMVSMSDAACNGTATGTATVNVVAPQTVILTSFPVACIDDPLINLSGGTPVGGVYSGTGVSNNQFDPSAGTQTITYTVTFAPGCTGSANQVYTVSPLPAVTLNSLGTACLSATPFTLTGGTPGGGTYSGSGVSANVFNPATAGLGTKIITYTFTNGAGCTNQDTALITVVTCTSCSNPPVANAGADRFSCNGVAVNLGGSISGGANSALWSGGNGTFLPNNTTLTANYTPTSAEIAAGQLLLFLTTNDPDGAGPCVADRDTVIIFFQNSVLDQNMTGVTGVCRPVNGVSYSVPVQSGVNYNWTVPTNVSIASGQGTSAISANWPSNGQAGNVCVTMSNGCGSKQVCTFVKLRTTLPGTPTSIKGFTSACRNEVLKYSCTRVSSADWYVWTPPVGATINGSSAPFSTVDTFVVVTFGPGYTGDTLRVSGANCKGLSSTQRKLRINRRTTVPSTPIAIYGNKNGLCSSDEAYYTRTTGGAVTYKWRTTVAGALINGLPSPVVTTDTLVEITWPVFTASGTLYVAATNACGTSAERSVTVKGITATPDTIIGPATVCTNGSAVYTTNPVYGATSYTWTLATGLTLQSGQGTTSINVKFNSSTSSKNIKVMGVNGCGNSLNKTRTVQPVVCPRLEGTVSSNNIIGMDAWPNPTSELLNISFNSPAEENYTVSLIDLTGRAVRSERITGYEGQNNLLWNMSGYQSGIYFLVVQSKEGLSQLRIVIE